MEMTKSLLTTVLVALALLQALGMAQVEGKLSILPLDKSRLVRLHRLGGRATLLLAVLVATMCLAGQRYATTSLRVQAHALLGALAIVVLLAKVAVANRFRRSLRYAKPLGLAAGLLIFGTFAFSALWYFIQQVG